MATTNEEIKQNLEKMQKVSEQASEKVRKSQKRQKFIIEQARSLALEPEGELDIPDLEQ
jgi:uncharacterized protein YacL (UPF0231 family)